MFIGAPPRDINVVQGDILICYGSEENIRNLSERLKGVAGDRAHREAVEKEKVIREEEGKELLQCGAIDKKCDDS